MKKKVSLTREENDLLSSFEKGEYKKVGKNNPVMLGLIKAAKSKKINLRISDEDLSLVKKKAEESGIPYQTLIGSLIHQYASGKIKISL